MTDPMIGTMISDRYALLELIGEGGMGRVYEARQEPIGRLVAVKILLTEALDNDRTVARFVTEARIIARLKHPNTVRLIDFGHLPGGAFFIVMEHLDGGSLGDLLKAGALPPRRALTIARQICASLAEAHYLGIIHRDLKPDNVMLDVIYGEDVMARVLDFGLAKVAPSAGPDSPSGLGVIELTLPGSRIGSPTYMSPEQAFARPLDGRADLYAVGVLLFEMLTGAPPFSSENTTGLCLEHLHSAAPDIAEIHGLDPRIETLVHRLLEKDRADRPADAAAVIGALDVLLASPTLDRPKLLEPRPAASRASPLSEEQPPPSLSGPAAWVIMGLALGFGAALMVFAIW